MKHKEKEKTSKKYTIVAGSVIGYDNWYREIWESREIIVYATNNRRALKKAREIDDDNWQNFKIKKIEEIY